MIFREGSIVAPSAPSWKYDLPGPNEAPITIPSPSGISNPPNYVGDIYLELPRATFMMRGLAIWGAVGASIAGILPLVFSIDHMISSSWIPGPLIIFCMLSLLSISVWLAVYYWRMDLEAPLDEPIRFNRARRKIYVYRFHHAGLRPFSRSAWGVKPEAYDWDDLHAEFCSIYGPMGSGGLIETVTLAVLKPGTNEVLDRFLFAHGGQEAKMYWAMAQLFMQQGPQALPKFDRPPRDWNNENHVFNLARRFAPKVQWPHDMDMESRTAP